jgi:hypothetical protein
VLFDSLVEFSVLLELEVLLSELEVLFASVELPLSEDVEFEEDSLDVLFEFESVPFPLEESPVVSPELDEVEPSPDSAVLPDCSDSLDDVDVEEVDDESPEKLEPLEKPEVLLTSGAMTITLNLNCSETRFASSIILYVISYSPAKSAIVVEICRVGSLIFWYYSGKSVS